MAVLSGSCFAHDLATFDRLLLACRHKAMMVRLKVLDRKGSIMMHVCIKCQHQRWTLLYQPNARMATTMNPTLVAFGTLEPTLQIQIVFWEIGRLTTHKQPRLKTAHHLGKLLVHGVSACLPGLPQQDELPLTLFPCGRSARHQGALHGLQILDVVANLPQDPTYDFQSAVNATLQTCQQRLCTPPFCACTLRSSESRTSCHASLMRRPGGCSGPPRLSLSIPRTAAQEPRTTSPASSATPGSPTAAQPVASRALSVRTKPRSLDAQGAGACASGGWQAAGQRS